MYSTREGWIALAALEPHFRERLQRALGLDRIDREELERVFTTESAMYWEVWAAERDLPLAALRD